LQKINKSLLSMKEFLKMTGAVLLGLCIFGVLSFCFSIVCLLGLMSSSVNTEQPVRVSNGSILMLDLSNTIAERSSDDFSVSYMSMSAKKVSTLGLMDIERALISAATDSKIKMLYIYSPYYMVQDPATAEALRDMILDFRQNSGKPVVAFAHAFNNFDYYVASAADSVFMRRMGDFALCGLGSEQMYLKGALDKFGITATVIRHGKFKAAVEPYLQEKMSEANREQISTYLNDFWSVIVSAISESRNIPVERINEHVNSMDLYSNDSLCISEGFVDGILFESDFKARIKAMVGLPQDDDEHEYVSVSDYNQTLYDDTNPKSRIAVIYADGEIVSESAQGAFCSGDICPAIQEAINDDNIKAVVLRVNSPGGVVVDAEMIYADLMRLKAKGKPLVVSMGGYAASGGYWISSLADRIFAQNNTVTGSIGVFGLMLSPDRLLKNTLGVNFEDVKTHEHSLMMNSINPMQSDEVAIMQRSVEDIYTMFLDHVSKGRNMTPGAVDSIAQGRVWTGKSALAIGLVDEIGSLSDAIDCAAELADIKSYRLHELPAQKDELTRIMEELMQVSARAFYGEEVFEKTRFLKSLSSHEGIQAYQPVMKVY